MCLTNMDISACERKSENMDVNVDIDVDINCFICLDVHTDSRALFQLRELCFEYYKNCSCTGYIHRNCLHSWFNTSANKCPICRNNMKKKTPLYLILYETSKHVLLICTHNVYLSYFYVLQNLYITTYNMAYIFFYFVGFIHVFKLCIIFYILCFSLMDKEENYDFDYANQDL